MARRPRIWLATRPGHHVSAEMGSTAPDPGLLPDRGTSCLQGFTRRPRTLGLLPGRGTTCLQVLAGRPVGPASLRAICVSQVGCWSLKFSQCAGVERLAGHLLVVLSGQHSREVGWLRVCLRVVLRFFRIALCNRAQ